MKTCPSGSEPRAVASGKSAPKSMRCSPDLANADVLFEIDLGLDPFSPKKAQAYGADKTSSQNCKLDPSMSGGQNVLENSKKQNSPQNSKQWDADFSHGKSSIVAEEIKNCELWPVPTLVSNSVHRQSHAGESGMIHSLDSTSEKHKHEIWHQSVHEKAPRPQEQEAQAQLDAMAMKHPKEVVRPANREQMAKPPSEKEPKAENQNSKSVPLGTAPARLTPVTAICEIATGGKARAPPKSQIATSGSGFRRMNRALPAPKREVMPLYPLLPYWAEPSAHESCTPQYKLKHDL